jgi:hypothetical protein
VTLSSSLRIINKKVDQKFKNQKGHKQTEKPFVLILKFKRQFRAFDAETSEECVGGLKVGGWTGWMGLDGWMPDEAEEEEEEDEEEEKWGPL